MCASSCHCIVCNAPADIWCDAGCTVTHPEGQCGAALCWAHATVEGTDGVDIRCPAHRTGAV